MNVGDFEIDIDKEPDIETKQIINPLVATLFVIFRREKSGQNPKASKNERILPGTDILRKMNFSGSVHSISNDNAGRVLRQSERRKSFVKGSRIV